MKNLEYCEFYRRNLPHIQPRGRTFLVNFRLAGSLPVEVIERLKADAEQIETVLSKIVNVDEKFIVRDREQRRLLGK